MLAVQLKNYLESVPDDANILIYVAKIGKTRQLLFGDIDRDHNGHVIFNAEYKVPPKHTTITGMKLKKGSNQ